MPPTTSGPSAPPPPPPPPVRSSLSATATPFVPQPRPYAPYTSFTNRPAPITTPQQPPVAGSPSALATDTTTPPPTHSSTTGLPYYDNHTPSLPSHMVPIYGSHHGVFYDPLTSLFYGDGPPRPTLDRPDGTRREMDTATALPRPGAHPEDVLNLQPRSVTRPAALAAEASAVGERRWFCVCRGGWLGVRHDCPDLREPAHAAGEQLPEGVTRVLRPGDRMPVEEMTHLVRIGDLSYMTDEQRRELEGSRFG